MYITTAIRRLLLHYHEATRVNQSSSRSTCSHALTCHVVLEVEHLYPRAGQALTVHDPRVDDAVAAARVDALGEQRGAVARVELEA